MRLPVFCAVFSVCVLFLVNFNFLVFQLFASLFAQSAKFVVTKCANCVFVFSQSFFMKTKHRIVNKFTNEADALKALISQSKCFDEMNIDSSNEYGHVGPRMISARAQDKEIARYEDILGSGDFYAVICNEDMNEFALITVWG